MNPFSVMVCRAMKRKHGWLVVLEYTIDLPGGPQVGTKLARKYHYHKDAVECATQAVVDLDNCPQFYPYDEVVQ